MANYLAPDPLQSTFFVPGGNTPGNGVQLFMYAAGTTTKQTAYQGSTTSTPWSNPIVLDSGGNLPSGSKEVWLVGGQSYKAVYAPFNDTDPPASPYRTLDNLAGMNDPSGIDASSEWVAGTTPIFVSGTSFTVVGDQTTTYTKGRRIKATVTAGTVYATITNVAFTTLTTVTVSGGALDSGLSAIFYGLLDPANPSISFYEVTRQSATTVPAATTTNIWGTDGDSVHITGSTAIANFGTAPYVGATKKIIFDGNPAIVHNVSTLVVPPSLGGATFTTVASTFATVYADSVTKMLLVDIPLSKQSRQVFTSVGATTYASPIGASKLLVRLVGGGAGGGGRDANNGNTGTTSVFGSLSAGGGSAGNANGGQGAAGGAASGGDININGGGGGAGTVNTSASTAAASGVGGNSHFGGGGPSALNATGGAGAANSGGGGAGGGGATATNSGGGGGAGAYVEKLFLIQVATTFPLTVGAGGTAGAAGGQAGGNGGSGIVIIDEYYN